MTTLASLLAIDPERYPHGTRSRYNAGRCRCLKCRMANARYESERKSRPFNGLVPAQAAREHIRALSTQGIGYKSVADAASVARSVVAKIRSGERTQVRAQTSERILRVDADAVADSAHVDARDTWRMLDELLAEGYRKTKLAALLGSEAKTPALQFRSERITARNALKVRRFYDAVMAESDEDIETPTMREQILRAASRFDWVKAEALFTAMGIDGDRNTVTQMLGRLVKSGHLERRGDVKPYEYRVSLSHHSRARKAA